MREEDDWVIGDPVKLTIDTLVVDCQKHGTHDFHINFRYNEKKFGAFCCLCIIDLLKSNGIPELEVHSR